MIRTGVNLLSLVLLALIVACATYNPGGSGTETTTGITGSIVNDKGDPQADVQVRLLPDTYDPVLDNDTISVDTTDSLGRYTFPDITSGIYSVQALNLTDQTRALICGIETVADTVVTVTGTLKPPGAVRVVFTTDFNTTRGYLYIPGTTFHVFLNDTVDYAVLDSVPEGAIPSISYASMSSEETVLIRQDLTVTSGDTLTVASRNLAYTKNIILNTSVSGADVQKDVHGFPVLVRLTANVFDFTQAKNGGEDIRFTSSAGRELPYEIERWDASLQRAAIWVRVDTIHGNDSTQTITMYWGNPDAASGRSNSSAVFDTDDGFAGIWHLNDVAGDSVHDATSNHYNGVSPENERPEQGDGVIGGCGVFDGSTDFITMPNTAEGALDFPVDGHFTVSAWVQLDSLDGESRLVVAKGYGQYFLRHTYFPTDSPLWEFTEFNSNDSWETCNTEAFSGRWALLTGVRAGGSQLLYYNGAMVDSIPVVFPANDLTRNTTENLTIGKFLNEINLPNNVVGYCFFKGAIDEVRIDGKARSAEWIRLCYMNQQPDDRLIVFK